jgi:hypothetical protein
VTKKIQPSEGTLKRIRDTSPTLPRIEATHVQEELGAEATDKALQKPPAPISLFALREEIVKRLQSSGGRPALEGVTRRAKIPLSDQEWFQLEELAAAISSPGFAPSAGQVASVLLTTSLHAVTAQITSGGSSSSVIRELAARAGGAAESTQNPTEHDN